jgi:hypothetical protein
MQHTRRILLFAALLLGATAVVQAEDGLYAAGSIGVTQEHYDSSYLNASSNDVSYQIGLGYRVFGVLAGELDYVGFPRAYSGINYADTYGVGVSVLGFLPISLLDVYGRVGLFDYRTNAYQSAPFNYSFHESGSDLTYGAGVGMHWGNVGARLEYDGYNVSHANQLNIVSLGVVWSFF